MHRCSNILLAFTCSLTLVIGPTVGWAAERFVLTETASGGVAVTIDGEPFTRYVVDQANKPFLWPIVGPAGSELTRCYPMKDVPGEATDHIHHRGLCFGHQSISGVDTWHELLTWKPGANDARRARLGRIRHDRYRLIEGGATGVIDSESTMLAADGRPVLALEQRLTFAEPEKETLRTIDVAIDLVAAHGPATVADFKDAGLSIRVAEPLRVDARRGGGILNSEGDRNAQVWAKRAAWVDYSGTIDGERQGIAFFSHPSSFRDPPPWHVRTYGLFTANPFGLKSLDLQKESAAVHLAAGERIPLRYRLVFHRGGDAPARLADLYRQYAEEPPASPGS
jgi:hypothetical protein